MQQKQLTKQVIRVVCGIAAFLLTAVILIGIFVYITRSQNTDPASVLPMTENESDKPTVDFSEFAAENRRKETVFDVSVEDFIEYFNRVYQQRNEIEYLNSLNSENWYFHSELSPCFGYEAVRYEFSEDRKIWPMPTISVYAPNNEEIYEIRLTFDDHGYQDKLHDLFRELCCCTEKMLMPELSEMETETMFEKLYSQAYMNFFGDHAAFGDPDRPQLNAVYRYDNIGMYCFYGSGNIEICFVPLPESAVKALHSEIRVFDDVG